MNGGGPICKTYMPLERLPARVSTTPIDWLVHRYWMGWFGGSVLPVMYKRDCLNQPIPCTSTIRPWQYSGIDEADPALIAQDMTTIKYIMWNYVGLVRTKPRLERALRELLHLGIEIE